MYWHQGCVNTANVSIQTEGAKGPSPEKTTWGNPGNSGLVPGNQNRKPISKMNRYLHFQREDESPNTIRKSLSGDTAFRF